MKVTVNGELRELPEDTTILGLLTALGAPPTGVAVAQNGEVVPRGEHVSRQLAAGDRVEVIRAVGGG